MKKNQMVLAAALMASMAGLTSYAAPAESLLVVDKENGQITANVTDKNFAVKYGDNRVNIDSTGIAIEGALKVEGQTVNLTDLVKVGQAASDAAAAKSQAEQNKKDIAANKQSIEDLTQNTKENFDSVNKQLAGQSKVNDDQNKAILDNKDAINANSEKLKEQGQVLTEHGAQLDHLSNEVYENQQANDKKNAEQDKIIDTNKWKADTALKLTGNGALQNGATDLTTGVNLNTQAIEKEQNAREDADTAIRKDFAAADEKTLSDAKAYTDSASKELGSRIDSIDKSNKKGVAKAAALAALHPQDYDPNAKWDFAAGFGNYGGENATALGAFYRPNRNVMFSLGGTLGGDDNAVNVGLSFKLGHAGQKVEEGSETTAKLYDMIGELQKKLDDQQKKIEALEAKEAK